MIDHLTASFYISDNNSSSIKFGSMDPDGPATGAPLDIFRTVNSSSWNLFGKDFSVDGTKLRDNIIVAGSARDPINEFSFDMKLPYIYVPDEDFFKWLEIMAIKF